MEFYSINSIKELKNIPNIKRGTVITLNNNGNNKELKKRSFIKALFSNILKFINAIKYYIIKLIKK